MDRRQLNWYICEPHVMVDAQVVMASFIQKKIGVLQGSSDARQTTNEAIPKIDYNTTMAIIMAGCLVGPQHGFAPIQIINKLSRFDFVHSNCHYSLICDLVTTR